MAITSIYKNVNVRKGECCKGNNRLRLSFSLCLPALLYFWKASPSLCPVCTPQQAENFLLKLNAHKILWCSTNYSSISFYVFGKERVRAHSKRCNACKSDRNYAFREMNIFLLTWGIEGIPRKHFSHFKSGFCPVIKLLKSTWVM